MATVRELHAEFYANHQEIERLAVDIYAHPWRWRNRQLRRQLHALVAENERIHGSLCERSRAKGAPAFSKAPGVYRTP